MKMFLIMLLLVVLILMGCQCGDEIQLLKFFGKLFIFNYCILKVIYNFVFDFQGKILDGSYVEVSFENLVGGELLKIMQKIFFFWEKLVLESLLFCCVVKDRFYKVVVSFFGFDVKKIQMVEIIVILLFDEIILLKNLIVVGLVYDMNLKVFVKGGEVDYSFDIDCLKV